MENPEQPHSTPPSNDLLDELHNLGKNLKELLQAVWEKDERKKAQKEIETGLNELAKTFSQAANEFSQSPTGQTLKADLKDINQRIQTGEVEAKVRTEVVSALRAANEGLKKATTGVKPPKAD
jgi:DNA-binding SARP family transcriptional activator